jgi:hypothetical protein
VEVEEKEVDLYAKGTLAAGETSSLRGEGEDVREGEVTVSTSSTCSSGVGVRAPDGVGEGGV